MFQKLAARSFVPVYLTARPEWLVARTRAFLSDRGSPSGILITRRDKSGGYACSTTVGDPKRRVLFRLDDAARRTRRIEAYDELLPEIDVR